MASETGEDERSSDGDHDSADVPSARPQVDPQAEPVEDDPAPPHGDKLADLHPDD